MTTFLSRKSLIHTRSMFMLRNQKYRTMLVAAVFGLAGASATYAFQDKGESGKGGEKAGEKTKHGELPDVVKSAADKFYGTSYTHKTTVVDGFTQYQMHGTKDGRETEAVFTESG